MHVCKKNEGYFFNYSGHGFASFITAGDIMTEYRNGSCNKHVYRRYYTVIISHEIVTCRRYYCNLL